MNKNLRPKNMDKTNSDETNNDDSSDTWSGFFKKKKPNVLKERNQIHVNFEKSDNTSCVEDSIIFKEKEAFYRKSHNDRERLLDVTFSKVLESSNDTVIIKNPKRFRFNAGEDNINFSVPESANNTVTIKTPKRFRFNSAEDKVNFSVPESANDTVTIKTPKIFRFNSAEDKVNFSILNPSEFVSGFSNQNASVNPINTELCEREHCIDILNKESSLNDTTIKTGECRTISTSRETFDDTKISTPVVSISPTNLELCENEHSTNILDKESFNINSIKSNENHASSTSLMSETCNDAENNTFVTSVNPQNSELGEREYTIDILNTESSLNTSITKMSENYTASASLMQKTFDFAENNTPVVSVSLTNSALCENKCSIDLPDKKSLNSKTIKISENCSTSASLMQKTFDIVRNNTMTSLVNQTNSELCVRDHNINLLDKESLNIDTIKTHENDSTSTSLIPPMQKIFDDRNITSVSNSSTSSKLIEPEHTADVLNKKSLNINSNETNENHSISALIMQKSSDGSMNNIVEASVNLTNSESRERDHSVDAGDEESPNRNSIETNENHIISMSLTQKTFDNTQNNISEISVDPINFETYEYEYSMDKEDKESLNKNSIETNKNHTASVSLMQKTFDIKDTTPNSINPSNCELLERENSLETLNKKSLSANSIKSSENCVIAASSRNKTFIITENVTPFVSVNPTNSELCEHDHNTDILDKDALSKNSIKVSGNQTSSMSLVQKVFSDTKNAAPITPTILLKKTKGKANKKRSYKQMFDIESDEKQSSETSLKLPKKINFSKFHPYCNKGLYDFLIKKMTSKYGIKTKREVVKLAEYIFQAVEEVEAMTENYFNKVKELKFVLARKQVIHTHYEFYMFCLHYLPPRFINKSVPLISLPGKAYFDESTVFDPVNQL